MGGGGESLFLSCAWTEVLATNLLDKQLNI